MNRAALLATLVVAFSAPASAAPRHSQSLRTAVPDVTAGTSCTDVPHLAYPATGGGPLIQHVKVVDVFYSPNFKYKAMLEDFYKAVLQSAYFDWLTEYNVTNYKIGRGSFVTSFEDSNTNPTTVKQINPETYLKGLIAAAKVPAPDDDTMYMLYFPSGIDPTDGTGPSCISNGDYCAYHSSYLATNGQNVRYGVMPDMDAGGCNMGCGPPGFNSFTDVSSHELIEAVTDPDGTGWYDDGADPNSQDNCGEIGDICAVGGTGEGAMVSGFFVQNEWSNKYKKCIAVDPNASANDFSLALSSTEVSVPAGGSVDVTVTLNKTAGVAESIALAAPTPPTGLTAMFAPASATSAGGTSTLTVSAGPTLAVGTALSLTVKGTGTTASHTATLAVTVTAPADMATSGGSGGNGGSGGSGDHGGAGGCAISGSSSSGGGIAGTWMLAGLLLCALAFRRRRA